MVDWKKIPKIDAHIGRLQYEELLNLDLYVNISAILTDLVERYGIEKNKILRKFDINKLIFASDYPDNRKIEPTEIYNKYFEILQQMDFT